MLSDKRVICGRNQTRCCFQWELKFFVTRQRVILLIEMCFSYTFHSTFCFALQALDRCVKVNRSCSTSLTGLWLAYHLCRCNHRRRFLRGFCWFLFFWRTGASCLPTTVKLNYLSSPSTKAFFFCFVLFLFFFVYIIFWGVCFGYFFFEEQALPVRGKSNELTSTR